MRYIWLVIVIVVIGYTVVNGLLLVTNLKSAAQASQMADEASATYLALIALTLAFWFCREPTRAQPPKSVEQPRPTAPTTTSAD